MAWRPLTVVSVGESDLRAVRDPTVTRRELAALANAKVPSARYWLCVAACWVAVSAGAALLNPRGVLPPGYIPSFLVMALGRLFGLAMLVALPTLAYVCITRWNRPFVFAARRELGDPVCSACGYTLPLTCDLCSECGNKTGGTA